MSQRTQKWISNVVREIDQRTDEATCAAILQACGRACTPVGLIEKAKRIYRESPDLAEFLSRLGEVFEAVQIEDGAVYVVYPRCYCEQIRDLPVEDVPDAYCHCSVGWIRQFFEQVLGRAVAVERVKTIVSGDAECRFKVTI